MAITFLTNTIDVTVLTNMFTVLMVIIGVLVVGTNIITEVLKKVTWNKLPTEILAFIVAIVLTVVAFLAYASYMSVAVLWYHVAAAVVVAFFVAYAAMFGYDSLKEALSKIDEISNNKT